jgi:glycosyltransferase involved in cell wall biosynthesis
MTDSKTNTGTRVAHVIHSDDWSGGPKSVAEWIQHSDNSDAWTVYHGGNGAIARACDEKGVTHVRIPFETKSTALVGMSVLFTKLRRQRPEVLVCHGQWAGVLGLFIGTMLRIPFRVYVARWPSFYTDWDLFRKIRNYACEKISALCAHRIIVLSQSSMHQYLNRSLANPEKLVCITNPISIPDNTDSLGKILRKKMGVDPYDCLVVFAGRLSTQKRVDWLLKSWARVTNQKPGATLWVIGDGENLEPLEAQAKSLSLGRSCSFLGAQPDGLSFIAAADIVAVVSEYESMGRVAAEAHALGKPVIAFDADAVRDVVTDGVNGRLIPLGDVESYARALTQMIDQPDLRQRLGHGGRVTSNRFAPDLIIPRIERALNPLITVSSIE